MASHAFGAVQDIIPDKKGGIHSIATAFGARATVLFSLALYIAAGITVAMQGSEYAALVVVAAAYCVNILPYLKVTNKTSPTTNVAWKRFLWLNYGAGAIVTMVTLAQIFL